VLSVPVATLTIVITQGDRQVKTIDFANYIFYYAKPEEKREFVVAIGKQLYIKNKTISAINSKNTIG